MAKKKRKPNGTPAATQPDDELPQDVADFLESEEETSALLEKYIAPPLDVKGGEVSSSLLRDRHKISRRQAEWILECALGNGEYERIGKRRHNGAIVVAYRKVNKRPSAGAA